MRKHALLVMTEEEADIEAILSPINNEPWRPDVIRVRAILDSLAVLAGAPSHPANGNALARLRKSLDVYSWRRFVAPTSEGLRVINRIKGESSSKWELDAVRMLLDLVPDMGKHPRIRRCGFIGCGRWFFASKRSDHKFCGGKCRQNEWDSDPERRAQKNAYMKAQRVQEKARAAKAEEAVGFVKKARVSR